MKPFFKYTAPALALLGLSLGSCKPDLEDSPKAEAGQADYLVTGDKAGVLAIGRHGKTNILTVSKMVSTLELG